MKTPKVSILMTTRNGSPFLRPTLESICNQSYRDWELIINNNQSQDNTLSVLKGFAAKDSRIRVIQNPTTPEIIDGLQYAFSHSQGEMITRMDSDDLMTENKLLSMVNKLENTGKGHVITGMIRHFSSESVNEGFKKYDQWLNDLMEKERQYDEIYRECVIPSSCWMVYRDDLLKAGAFGRKIYPEDYDLCFRFYEKGLKVLPIKKVLHLWRDHPKRVSRNDPRYADQLYYSLKLYYFKRNDWNKNQPVVLWGAGKKGKKLARELQKKQIPFLWICDNPNKIGHIIYEAELQPIHLINRLEFHQILIAVSSRDKEKLLRDIDRTSNTYFWFC